MLNFSNQNKHTLERRSFDISLKEFVLKNSKASKKNLNEYLENVRKENRRLRKKRELTKL